MKYCIFFFALFILGACTNTQWVTESGLRADKNTLTNALNQCNFEKRRKEALAYLDKLNSGNLSGTSITKDETQNPSSIDDHTIECMARKGFKLS